MTIFVGRQFDLNTSLPKPQNHQILLPQSLQAKASAINTFHNLNQPRKVLLQIILYALLEQNTINLYIYFFSIVVFVLDQILKVFGGFYGCWCWLFGVECQEVEEGEGNCCVFKGQQRTTDIQQQQYFSLVVVTPNDNSLLKLRPSANSSILFLQENFQIRCTLILNLKRLYRMITFITHKDINLQVIFRTVEIIDRDNLTTYLNLLVFKKYVLCLETLFFIFLTLLLMGKEFLKFCVHYYYKVEFKRVFKVVESVNVNLQLGLI